MDMIVDDVLTARTEEAIVAERSAFAEGMAALHPDGGATWIPVAGGRAIFTGAGYFSNRALGIGLDGPVVEADIRDIESFYSERGLTSRIEIPCTVERPLVRLLGQLDYRVDRFHNIYAQRISEVNREPADRPGIDVEAVSDSVTAEAWSSTLLDGFGYTTADDREHVQRWNDMLRSLSALTAFTARLNGQPAGSASVLVVGNTAVLGGAATKPEFRRRGVQQALIESRLALAMRAGCDIAVVTADPGSISGRNAERTGFQLVGTHVAMCAGRA